MIPRRALISSLKQQQPHSSLKTNPNISRFSTSPSPNPNPKPSLFHSSPLFCNQRLLGSFFSSQWVSVSVNDAINTTVGGVRFMSTRMMNDSSNRPPKETMLLDGCDFEHWLVVVETPDLNLTRDEMIDIYIKTLAQARMKIYSVSTRHYFAFGCLVSEDLSYKIKDLPNVRWVLPDSYLDVRNKDYGGEPFIDGQAVPYDPKYHEDWLRNKNKVENNTRRHRTRRQGNFESPRENMNMMKRDNPPSPTPKSNAQAPHGPNQNFTPTPNYQNQTPSSPMQNRDYSNRNMQPPQMQNSDFQQSMPPQMQKQNQNFHNRDMPPPMQNQNFQNSYSQQPIQNPGFQSGNVPSYGNSQSMNMSPQSQNWNSHRRDMPPPMQNQDFQHRNTAPSLQNQAYQSRDMPPMQNYNFNKKDMPPMLNHDFQNRNMGDVQQGAYQNQNMNMNTGNGQSRNYEGQNLAANGNTWNGQNKSMGISQNFHSQNVGNGEYEAVANRN